jgi:hypothetical protein
MCPFCMASVGLIVAGTVSTGGLAALAVKLSRKNKPETQIIPNSNERSNQDVNK